MTMGNTVSKLRGVTSMAVKLKTGFGNFTSPICSSNHYVLINNEVFGCNIATANVM